MATRYKDALVLAEGGTHPFSCLAWLSNVMNDLGKTMSMDEICRDPAIRLILLVIADLVGLPQNPDVRDELKTECRIEIEKEIDARRPKTILVYDEHYIEAEGTAEGEENCFPPMTAFVVIAGDRKFVVRDEGRHVSAYDAETVLVQVLLREQAPIPMTQVPIEVASVICDVVDAIAKGEDPFPNEPHISEGRWEEFEKVLSL